MLVELKSSQSSPFLFWFFFNYFFLYCVIIFPLLLIQSLVAVYLWSRRKLLFIRYKLYPWCVSVWVLPVRAAVPCIPTLFVWLQTMSSRFIQRIFHFRFVYYDKDVMLWMSCPQRKHTKKTKENEDGTYNHNKNQKNQAVVCCLHSCLHSCKLFHYIVHSEIYRKLLDVMI